MLKRLGLLRAEYKVLETKLMTELRRKSPNQSRIQKFKKLKRHVYASILMLLTRKSIARSMRNKRRARRLNRLAYSYQGPARYNFTF